MTILTILRLRVRVLCVLTVCGFIVGCGSKKDVQTVENSPPQPVLAAATDPQITLFGELPGTPTSDYEARELISLRQNTYPPEGSDFDPCVSRDGKWLVYASTRHSLIPDLYMQDVDGVAITQLTSDPASDVQPAISPDGHRVAFASDRSGNWDVWVINVDGQQPIQVTTGSAQEVHPSWSPDGKQLVFCSLPERGGQWELWTASAEAGAIKKFIGYGLFPEWAPKSNTILFQRARRRGSHWFSLWTLTLVNGEPRMPTEILSSAEHAMILPTWSPDEKQVAYCAVESATPEPNETRNPLSKADLWLADADGRGQTRLSDGVGANYSPCWSSLGRIYFCSNRSNHNSQENIWSIVPLRAPMAQVPSQEKSVANRTDQQRANEVQKQTDTGHVETVAMPVEKPEESH